LRKIPIDYEAINNDYDEDLKMFLIEHCFENKDPENVKIVTLCYNLTELKELRKIKNRLI